ncbi:MAG: response regulator [Acidobacteriota bacterium]|nr:response regulator [Acidobacteriota bacterium]
MAKRILLADDSITIQKVVELTFSDGDYEVTAVNNGNKAVQKLSEMRPDIILSDIIMPEKNGYEVCEYVKSHPEYRNIPVILLTGTFEPFDPDRADKAGCDAVVTKPFESQSLIHKVEELIEHARSQATTAQTSAVSAPPPAASPTPSFTASDSPFATAPPQPKRPDSFGTGTFPSSGEVFAASGSSSRPTTEIPLEQPPTTGETRAFPKMSFEDIPPAPPTTGAGETRAFPKLTFEDIPKPASPPPPPPSPWDEPAPTGETRGFPKMSFDDFQKSEPAPMAPPPLPTPEAPPWDARPSGNFETSETKPPAPAPWDEKPAGETRAFPKMSFEDLDKTPAKPAAQDFSFTPPAPNAPAPPSTASSTSSSGATSGELSEEQIDKIARRVVQLLSDQVVRNIAWEVIPDLAETVVKERIRQLESE